MAALLLVLFISLTSWILSLPHNNKCSDDGCTDNNSPHQANGTTQQSRSKEPSLLQHPNCSLQTVICFENKTQAEGRRQSLQSSISWNCTSSSGQVNIYNCKDRAFNTTKMCCEFSIKKRNRTESTGPAYCLERHSDHTGKTSLPSWDCYWQFSVLQVLSTSGLDDGKQALYFSDCKTPNSNSYIHNCSDSGLITKNETSPSFRPGSATTSAKPIHTYQIKTTPGYSTAKTTQPGTASTEKKHKNKLSSQNTTFTALGESLTGKAKLHNCTSHSIQTSLVEMEDIARQKMGEILRANLTGELSFRNQIIELHLVVTRDFNNTITVPDPSKADKPFHSLVSVLPGSIDAKHGRLGLLVVVFYFKGLCNEREDVNVMASSNGYSSLQSPIVSVLAMSPKGDINTLKDNATITFRSKITDQSTAKCVFLNRTGSSGPFWSDDGMTLATDQKANYITCLTDHFTSFAVLIDFQNDMKISEAEKLALDLITKVGCGISLVCLVACILTFGCFRNLSMTRYRIHLNLCIALAASQLVFLAGIEATSKKGVCLAVAIMLHYFFTASFSWMCIEAFHLFTKIVSVFNLQQIRMRYYFAVGWGTPAIIVMITVLVSVKNLRGYTTPELCWLSLERGLIWAFISPVIIIILINVAVLIAVVVVRVSLKGNPLTPSENKKLSAALRTVVVLFPLLGLCWAFGVMAVVTKRRPFLYAFALLSSLQGAFICLFQCIGSTEVRGSLRSVKHRYSIESSIRHELKRKRESRSNGSKKDKNKPESKSLLSMLSVSHCDRKDKPTATEV